MRPYYGSIINTFIFSFSNVLLLIPIVQYSDGYMHKTAAK